MEKKEIIIIGQHNRYEIKKITKDKRGKETKISSASKKWCVDNSFFTIEKQQDILNDVNAYIVDEYQKDVSTKHVLCFMQLLKAKINSYKSQDIKKFKSVNDDFVTELIIIEKLNACNLKCRFCKKEMFLLYDKVRDIYQWTLDRIDNDLGHTKNNVNIVCLRCNLKRGKRTETNFLKIKYETINKLS